MFASGVGRRGCMSRIAAALLLIALSVMTSKAIAGAPPFNRPLGEVHGKAPAQVSVDGKNWIPLGSGTLPALDKMLIRARSGVFALTLTDGSRLEASPTTELVISRMESSTIVRVVEGNVLFRLRPASSVRIAMPGGVIQSADTWSGRADRIPSARVRATTQGHRDTLGVITAQRVGVPRVRIVSGEAVMISQNGSVTERLREGQVRTLSAQSSRTVPLKQYAAAQPGGQQAPPPTDPPSQAPKAEHVWTWHPSYPQEVQGGWQEMRLGVPPTTPPTPEQEVREGFAWAWKDQWVVAKRECGQFAGFRRASSDEAKLPPPVDPPSQSAKAEHVWAWHPSNPPDVWGGWQEVQLGSPPADPPRPEQELYRGFGWAWEEKPEKRWVVVEECGLAAAFFVPAGSGIAGLVIGGATVGAASVVPATLTGGGDDPVASDVAPK
ncbi:hypothetical protein MELA_00875 [Candidatus Methylomirabilis lanthanidiphila]|uniref:FecR protein n=1 Tax=Candidatus Methylomirabilis lanthanidiphila TaxID=2211376 RepID=A0A564ZIN8_9BACT|nr:hypothetical protein MELA_00875 [Candidatus Methylomirabilis lanthanidiphila]